MIVKFQKNEMTSFSEAIIRLDMNGSVRDINRANYMTKVWPDRSRTHKFINLLIYLVQQSLCSRYST